tara:strand:+ start:614 stop:871 length:258 start_codon:yes stop_codon:yes gene_type:complete
MVIADIHSNLGLSGVVILQLVNDCHVADLLAYTQWVDHLGDFGLGEAIKPDAAIFYKRYFLAGDSAGYELVRYTNRDKIQLRINI